MKGSPRLTRTWLRGRSCWWYEKISVLHKLEIVQSTSSHISMTTKLDIIHMLRSGKPSQAEVERLTSTRTVTVTTSWNNNNRSAEHTTGYDVMVVNQVITTLYSFNRHITTVERFFNLVDSTIWFLWIFENIIERYRKGCLRNMFCREHAQCFCKSV